MLPADRMLARRLESQAIDIINERTSTDERRRKLAELVSWIDDEDIRRVVEQYGETLEEEDSVEGLQEPPGFTPGMHDLKS